MHAINGELDRLRDKIAENCGVPSEALPISVVAKAATEPLFLHHLVTTAGDSFLFDLLVQSEASALQSWHETVRRDSALFGSSAKAALKWIASGARFASKEIVKLRLKTCRSCPHRRTAPRTGMYALMKSQYVCELCGCDIDKKAILLSEKCPDTEYSENGRW